MEGLFKDTVQEFVYAFQRVGRQPLSRMLMEFTVIALLSQEVSVHPCHHPR